jgi:FtsZ-binding cell division protein ZapB
MEIPYFQDPERDNRVFKQKVDAMSLLFDEIVELQQKNPNSKETEHLKQVCDFLTTKPKENDELLG